ncbi:hypothetical protein JCM17844_11850 [Iodidimonas gelatinilytica]|uniref:Fatty acid hydroxylase domain-containing protein n=1 Tax=Iodidimonas gelatinilytica TaxID=1236966 RepID=A0A5A7MRF6_9PROT|nr:sterol desaturase family protein [Iodidimonas gelatinilytica]GEQ97548.1 hypothetical protein JCM17844_11850 [Iodidimonas gelatinilytica]
MVRRILVTPDFHLVHHSTLRRDHDTNYGFNLPWWDYAFGTYKARPDKAEGYADRPSPMAIPRPAWP